MKKDFFLRPLDTLFFRDGRPFGEASRSGSGLPLPQTLYGAVMTALLRHYNADFEKLAAFPSHHAALSETVSAAPWISEVQIRGPWLAKKESTNIDLFYNSPAILLKSKIESEKHCFQTLPKKIGDIPGWNSPNGLRPLWTSKASSEATTGFLNQSAMSQFLNGHNVEKKDILAPGKIFDFQSRTGIGIDADTNATEKSVIYAAKHLCMNEGFGFAFSLEWPDSATFNPQEVLQVLAWGGEGRRVLVEPVDSIPHPQTPLKPGHKPLVILTTPAIFNPEKPWKPGCFAKSLCAAAVPSSFCVSGWDFRKGGPKPSKFGIPAGSTFFLNDASEIPTTGSLCNQETALAGWGCFLKGAWKDE